MTTELIKLILLYNLILIEHLTIENVTQFKLLKKSNFGRIDKNGSLENKL